MNTLTTIFGATLLISAAGLTAQVQATEFIAADNSIDTQLCMAVASNKRSGLSNEMKTHRIKKVTMTEKLLCNDMSVATFASTYNLDTSAKYLNVDLNTRTSIRDLSAKSSAPSTLVISGSK